MKENSLDTLEQVACEPSPTPGAHAPLDADELVATIYSELRAIAAGYFSSQPVGHTLQPTALVNEAVLRLFRDCEPVKAARWRTPGHFLAVAAIAMRQVLIDHARAKAALKRRGVMGGVQICLDSAGFPGPPVARAVTPPVVDLLELNEAIDRLAALDERAARVGVLRFFAGLTIAQVAEVLGVSDFTVENDWRAARAFLSRELAPAGAPRAEGA
jgi:RNA polymerase sigma factor (TIGR02999 family)